MRTVSDLNSKRNTLIADATELVTTRGLHTAEDKAKHKSYLAQIDELQSDIDALEKIERWQRSLPTPAPVQATPVITVTPESPEKRKAKINREARTFFRTGQVTPELRDLLTATDAAGGGLVAQSFDDIFVEASKYFGPVWNLINRKDSVDGAPTKFIVTDDTSRTFSLISEGSGSARAVAQQPTMFSNVTNGDTLATSIIYSFQELDDAFDLQSFLIKNAGLAVSRAWEYAVTLGLDNGSNSALPNSPAGGLLAGIPAGVTQTTGTLAAGPTYAQLSALAGSVDRSYYVNGAFMASPSVETFLRSQVDTTGRALYPVDPITGLLTIAGRVLYPNAAMPAAGTASSQLVLFGDYSRAYNVLNAGGVKVKVVTESQANNILTGELILYTRLGASAGLTTAVKALVSASS